MLEGKKGRRGFTRGYSVKEATNWLIDYCGKALSCERVRQLLHKLGLVRRVPGYHYVFADPAEQKRFIKEFVQTMNRPDVLDGRTVVLCFDEATIREHPTRTTLWSEKGVRPVVPTTGGHKKIHLYGSIEVRTGRTLVRTKAKLNSEKVCQYLSELKQKFPNKKVILFWDNHKSHTSGYTMEFIRRQRSWLEVKQFPKYSPKLNPVEQLWRWLREKVTHNRFYKSFTLLKQKLYAFFSYLQNHPQEVANRCKLNPH